MTLDLGAAGSEAESEQKLARCPPGALRRAGIEAGLPQKRFRGWRASCELGTSDLELGIQSPVEGIVVNSGPSAFSTCKSVTCPSTGGE